MNGTHADVTATGGNLTAGDEFELQAPVIDSRESYRAAWRSYALRRYLALFLLGVWLPVAVGLFLVSRFGWHQPLIALSLILLWLVSALAAGWWAGEFRCPRCRRRYGALGHKKGDTNYTRGLFDKACANCKLRKFELG